MWRTRHGAYRMSVGPLAIASEPTARHNGGTTTGRSLAGGKRETMDMLAHLRRRSGGALWLARPRAIRLIATLGVVVTTIGLYTPFAGRDWMLQGDPASRRAETWAIENVVGVPLAFLHLERMSLPSLLGFLVLHDVLTLGGLALIPLLWRPLSPRGAVWVRWTYAAWLSLLVILAVAGLPAWWWQVMAQPLQEPSSLAITVGAPYLLPGAVVFPLGALVSCASLLLMLREPLPVSPPTLAPRTGWQWASALTLTVGALAWGVGFYLMPEAVTAPCPAVIFSVTQFAHGACAGIDSDQALAAVHLAGLNPIARALFTAGWNFELLVAMGGITTLGGWTRQLTVNTLAWLAAWPILALGVALVALQGVGAAARQGFRLTVASGADWRLGPGMIVTFAGIGLVTLGQLGLWWLLVRWRRAASAP